MKLLVTVAHPDDEAFGCGSLLAHATACGVESFVACATAGELGEVAPAVLAEAADATGAISPGRLGEIRAEELRAATSLLGVARVETLGWHDSGVDGEPEPGSLCAAPTDEVVSAIVRLVEEIRPDIVVTLDASDGHRDHAVIRDATLAAVTRSVWRPQRTYLYCLLRSLLTQFTGVATLGTPDERITTVVDTSAYLDLRWRAMRAHASQTPPYEAMDVELQRAFLVADRLRRVDPPWTGGELETDWRPVTVAERPHRGGQMCP